ncbi:hypothetical protein [Rhodopirellula baltica]|uniref:hypothetical protein n=1 Tax=Rhodopirellula baltica TaxID=265606 RepID=UPI0002DE0EED|nr:hypothetical protein [Rhodopirellula baltica]
MQTAAPRDKSERLTSENIDHQTKVANWFHPNDAGLKKVVNAFSCTCELVKNQTDAADIATAVKPWSMQMTRV